ncbi:MAG: hypothetical protein EA361_04145 [Bacteroidetes bacterium]|nr:MAG: hypothetical protein EA361_04145 [Bacteroidota bacterium]
MSFSSIGFAVKMGRREAYFLFNNLLVLPLLNSVDFYLPLQFCKNMQFCIKKWKKISEIIKKCETQ